MTFRLVGLALTLAAVLVLLTSMVLGMRADGAGGGDPLARTEGLLPSTERVRVEVLNGGTIVGAARAVTERLRDQGYDVVYYGNAGRLSRDSSVVLARSADPAGAQRVARELGIDRIETAVDTSLYLEATVVIGNDLPVLELRRR